MKSSIIYRPKGGQLEAYKEKYLAMGRCNNLTINNGENRVVRTDHKQVSMRRSIYRLTERGLLFLGAFAKLRKATIGFVTSVRPSV